MSNITALPGTLKGLRGETFGQVLTTLRNGLYVNGLFLSSESLMVRAPIFNLTAAVVD